MLHPCAAVLRFALEWLSLLVLKITFVLVFGYPYNIGNDTGLRVRRIALEIDRIERTIHTLVRAFLCPSLGPIL